MKILQLLQWHVEHHRVHSFLRPNTLKSYSVRLFELTKAMDYLNFQQLEVTTITRKDGQQILKALIELGYGNYTAIRAIRHLGMVIDCALQEEKIMLATNPIRKLRLPKVEENEIIYLNDFELDKLHKAKIPDNLIAVRDAFLFCCYTGLAWVDYDDFAKQCRLQKFGNSAFIHIRRTKTGSECIIPLMPVAMEILKKYGFLLPRTSNQKCNQKLKEIARYAKIDILLTFHVARKTACCYWLNAGVSRESVCKALGDEWRTVEKCYAVISKKKVFADFEVLMK